MRSRLSALVLSLVLASAFAACNKQRVRVRISRRRPTTRWRRTSLRRRITAKAQSHGAATSAADGSQRRQQQMAGSAAAGASAATASAPPLVVPAGASLVVRMGNTIDTKTAHDGDSFTGTLAQSVAVDGVVAIPSGAGVAGTVVQSKSPGRFKGEGTLSVALTSINVRGVPTYDQKLNLYPDRKRQRQADGRNGRRRNGSRCVDWRTSRRR